MQRNHETAPSEQSSVNPFTRQMSMPRQNNLSDEQKDSLEVYFKELTDNYDSRDISNGNVAHATILALDSSISNSDSMTSQQILRQLSSTIDYFCQRMNDKENVDKYKSKLRFKALCEIYQRMIMKCLGRKGIDLTNIQVVKDTMHDQSAKMADYSKTCNNIIVQYSQNLLRDGMTILVHSYSSVVIEVLRSTKERGIRVQVIVTESQPYATGQNVKEFCEKEQIPCKLVLDASVGLVMSQGQVDAVFVGAEAVLENGGIVNRVGTLTIALCAKAYDKPLYVFAESLKFLKRFPLNQSDIFDILDEDLAKKDGDDETERSDVTNTQLDYTAPEFISEMFTDIGIFTPAAVSDELIKFFQ